VTSIVDALARDVRATRKRRRLTQAELAAMVGVHQTWISDIELGRGTGVPLSLWVAIGVALDRPLAVAFSKDSDPDRLADAGHLEIQEALARLAATTGRRVDIERPSRPEAPTHSTDVRIRDDLHRVVILAEAWNTFADLGAAIRSTHRKSAEAATDIPRTEGWRVATVWVVRASAANRAILARYPHLLAATFKGSSRRWVHALADGTEPPDEPGLVWFDAGSRRLTAWRRPRRAGTMGA
jgi:transcriptional regulator with XRE-family HTH domain